MEAEISIDVKTIIGNLNKKIYGQFIEHLGRCIYGGIWVGEGSRIPNIRGFRKDVLEAIKALKPPLVRWPGGNFVSNYHWEDGVGPRDKRPKRFDMAWSAVEPNQFGTCEFIEWCRLVGAEPYIVVNAGNGTPEEAARWVEYCNLSGESFYASLRRSHGYLEPFNVKLWGVGNELYGEWQVGFCIDGKECARRTIEFVNEMKKVDPTIEIVAVGSDLDMEWNIDMVKHAGKYFDYLSIHRYVFTDGMGYRDLIEEAFDWEKLLHTTYNVINMVAKKVGLKKIIKIAFDEWNVWYPEAKPPLLYQVTSVRDAVFTGLVLNSFQRLCQELAFACFAQTVNVLPLIVTDEDRMYLNPQYLVFQLYVESSQDRVVKCTIDSPSFYSKKLDRPIEYINAVANMSQDENKLAIHIVNMNENEDATCKIKIKHFKPHKVIFNYVSGERLEEKNDFDNPKRVQIKTGGAFIEKESNTVELVIRKHSVNCVVIEGTRVKI